MSKLNRNTENQEHASHLPEHGPIDENGKEVLLSLKNVDITFGKGDNAVRAVKNATFDIHKGETFSLVGEQSSVSTHWQTERFCTKVCVFPGKSQNPWIVKSSVTSRWYSRIRQLP